MLTGVDTQNIFFIKISEKEMIVNIKIGMQNNEI